VFNILGKYILKISMSRCIHPYIRWCERSGANYSVACTKIKRKKERVVNIMISEKHDHTVYKMKNGGEL